MLRAGDEYIVMTSTAPFHGCGAIFAVCDCPTPYLLAYRLDGEIKYSVWRRVIDDDDFQARQLDASKGI